MLQKNNNHNFEVDVYFHPLPSILQFITEIFQ